MFIASSNAEANERAKQIIEGIVREVVVGEVYLGTVKRIEKFGCFVEILPNKDGLVHISQVSSERVAKVEDVLKIGDQITVKVTEIDAQGRINLSRKAVLRRKCPHNNRKQRTQAIDEEAGEPVSFFCCRVRFFPHIVGRALIRWKEKRGQR